MYQKYSKKDKLLERNKKLPDFLLAENRRDGQKRRPDDPDYDPSTLYISSKERAELTEGMKRYWEIKRTSMT